MVKIVFPAFIGIFLLLSYLLLSPSSVGATEEYAKQTAQKCAVCHLDPGGGGELSVAGIKFKTTRQIGSESPDKVIASKVFRLAVGYIHFITAIFWFGTILYVHLILKPTYAVGGLPRGEMKVGIYSMIIMGLTGTLLTCYRVPSFDILFHTRFGTLLLIKVALYLIMVISAAFVITVIGPRLKAKRKKLSPGGGADGLTLEDLASYDGKEGRPAWFAYKGIIYEATHSQLWKQGVHMGKHNAGSDLTNALSLAPHDQEKVTAMPAVGVLVASGPQKKPLHERVFFIMAYMNLLIVLLIVLILSLWRWG